MIDEEKKAIKELDKFSNLIDMSGITAKEGQIILNLIEKQQKEIEYWKKAFQREYENNGRMSTDLVQQDLVIRKKDKQIDLMAKELTKLVENTEEEVKQYFEKEAENGD